MNYDWFLKQQQQTMNEIADFSQSLTEDQLTPCTCHPLHRKWLHDLPPLSKGKGRLCSMVGCLKCQGFEPDAPG